MNFYQRPEWLRIRYRILRKYGFKCMICNRGKEQGAVIHVDHIKPKAHFPELAFCEENLQVLCAECNLGKSDRYADDVRPMVQVSQTIRAGKRFRFGNKPWREITREQRRRTAIFFVSRKVKNKIALAEIDGDPLKQAELMKTYLGLQRRLKSLVGVDENTVTGFWKEA